MSVAPLRTLAALAVLGLAACEEPQRPPWQLVGVYDATALYALAPGGAPDSTYTWSAAAEMNQSCGPAWSPEGLGVNEAVALSSGLTPALAVLLIGTPGGPDDLTRSELTLSYRRAEESTARGLEPAVAPLNVKVHLDPAPSTAGSGDLSSAEGLRAAVEQQVVTNFCLQHKLGRAWIGGDQAQVDEALLLDRQGAKLTPDLYFVGFGAPVPPLLGPERACIEQEAPPPGRPEGLDAVATIQPGDIWNAALPPCDLAPPSSPADVAPTWFGALRAPVDTAPRTLDLALHENLEHGLMLKAQFAAQVLFDEPVPQRSETESVDGRTVQEVLIPDVLAYLPRTYPHISGLRVSGLPPWGGEDVARGEEGDTYTLLIVPAWQLLGTDRLALGDAAQDAVGEVLSDLSGLSVQVRDRRMPSVLWELNPLMDQHWRAALSWGYPLGSVAAEGPVALVGPTGLGGASASNASRGPEEGLLLTCMLLLGGLALASTRGLPDLWRRPPELRLERWVQRPPDEEAK